MADEQSALPPGDDVSHAETAPIAAAAQEQGIDVDSAYDDDEIGSYATSISSSVERYTWENGRRYHNYREGIYHFPNDDLEQDRLDLNHHLCLMLLEDELHHAPLADDRPLRILDVGTGTGIWAMDMGDKFPSAEVIGNDLSPIQPKWVPPNVSFDVDDCESSWPPRAPFDFIHMRYLLASIRDWPALLRQAYEQTAPGGWIEVQDLNTHGYSEDGSASPDNMFFKFCQVFNRACDKMGRTGSPGKHLKGWVEGAGFTKVQHKMFKVPMGPWPEDPTLKRIGAVNIVLMSKVLDTALPGLLTRVEGWMPEEVEIFIAQIRADMKKKSAHMLQEYHVVWGQRPEVSTTT